MRGERISEDRHWTKSRCTYPDIEVRLITWGVGYSNMVWMLSLTTVVDRNRIMERCFSIKQFTDDARELQLSLGVNIDQTVNKRV